MKFTTENKQVWKILFERQIENINNHACSMYLEGINRLQLSADHIPNLKEINSIVEPVKNWKVVRTDVRYMSTESWYKHLARKEFIITNFLRTRDELDFTPEPDLFHDLFGHLPFLTIAEYMELIELFAPAYFAAESPEQEDAVKRLAWFSYEFGLIREAGKTKIFGAGIISSKGELEKVINGEILVKKFTVDNVLKRNKAIFDYNEELFIFDSFEELIAILAEFFNSFKNFQELRKLNLGETITTFSDTEMEFSN